MEKHFQETLINVCLGSYFYSITYTKRTTTRNVEKLMWISICIVVFD
jgi:hypothetical protein